MRDRVNANRLQTLNSQNRIVRFLNLALENKKHFFSELHFTHEHFTRGYVTRDNFASSTPTFVFSLVATQLVKILFFVFIR